MSNEMNQSENNTQVIAQDNNLAPAQVRNQINLIQQIMKDVMQEGQHYGIIPGCGDKHSLYKSGAEKLSLTFRLAPKYEIIYRPLLENNHREYEVVCSLIHIPTGIFQGEGVGSCSTMESKYRYRGNEKISTGEEVPQEYWSLKKSGNFEAAQQKIGGKGFSVSKIDGKWQICTVGEKVENPNIADTYNTVLKMAKKRAYVDAMLSVTAASDIFTQDIEDFKEDNTKEIDQIYDKKPQSSSIKNIKNGEKPVIYPPYTPEESKKRSLIDDIELLVAEESLKDKLEEGLNKRSIKSLEELPLPELEQWYKRFQTLAKEKR